MINYKTSLNLVYRKDEILFFENYFSYPVLSAGITLKGLGDFNISNNGTKKEWQKALEKFKYFKNEILKSDYLFLPRPQHENDCWIVEPGDVICNFQECDALFLSENKFPKEKIVTLAFTTGDCPIILGSDQKKSFLIHSGLYGASLKAANRVISQLSGEKGLQIRNTKILIWPGMCPDCFEIGNDWREIFGHYIKNNRLDLSAVIVDQLLAAGVLAKNMLLVPNICSYKSNLLYSYRREKNNPRERLKRNLVFLKTKT